MEVGQGPAQTVTVTANRRPGEGQRHAHGCHRAEQVNDIPLAGRNWVTLLKVVPGANAIASTNEQHRL